MLSPHFAYFCIFLPWVSKSSHTKLLTGNIISETQILSKTTQAWAETFQQSQIQWFSFNEFGSCTLWKPRSVLTVSIWMLKPLRKRFISFSSFAVGYGDCCTCFIFGHKPLILMCIWSIENVAFIMGRHSRCWHKIDNLIGLIRLMPPWLPVLDMNWVSDLIYTSAVKICKNIQNYGHTQGNSTLIVPYFFDPFCLVYNFLCLFNLLNSAVNLQFGVVW